ncbi:MAG: AMP-binding protein, partial [Aquincola sp.]|nr:AMP-binding protein [Aquincola sp.]
LRDARATAVVAPRRTRAAVEPLLPNGTSLAWFDPEEVPLSEARAWRHPVVRATDTVFLQYTSGSTGEPKGVQVSHGNILHNCRSIQRAMAFSPSTRLVSWLPYYHDMGLFSNVLMPVFVGFSTFLMPPPVFTERPVRWLQAITRFRGTIAGAPNFAYQLCAERVSGSDLDGLDLSSWQVAFNGAEPLRSETLDRFANLFAPAGFDRRAFFPCYGLAEASLFVAGGDHGAGATVLRFDARAIERAGQAVALEHGTPMVSSGWAPTVPDDVRSAVAIVEPATGSRCADGTIGEVWTSGDSVTKGYWANPVATSETFVESSLDGGQARRWLRTGDLGFVHQGRLFVSGRLKDVIKFNGRNIFPQDLEALVQAKVPGAVPGGAAAFAVSTAQGEAIVLVCEVDRHQAREFAGSASDDAFRAIVDAVSVAVAHDHGASIKALLLVPQGGVPKTTSGKTRRRFCRDLFERGEFPVLKAWRAVPAAPAVEEACTADGLYTRVARIWCSVLGVASVAPDDDFFALGGQSLAAGLLLERLNAAFGISLSLQEAFEASTLQDSIELVRRHVGTLRETT